MSNASHSPSPSISSTNAAARRLSRDNNDLLFSPPPLSLLSARRPSWTPPYESPSSLRTSEFTSSNAALSNLRHETIAEPDSPEDGGNFGQSLQIDMKGLVGDAIGNMSISPTSRDIVLAARKGLFIIDLEAPLEVPRFLPQGGTWDVADVQWNPHPQRAEYIVSTSSERLLIWNLFLVGKTAIEHILQSHYRAITDINWHTSEPDLVCSTGIDSWIWAWDLRTPMKPVFGLCAFNAGGTQIKWNRQDQHILASSHLNEVLVWDRRKGSEPLLQIKAHKAKIYGIDWSHHDRNEIVTCSLDKTVKIWDIHDPKTQHEESKLTYETMYPVWRARDLPFGKGFLSLPQRGETALEMWSHSDTTAPVETFEGHTDVVKEFVWRYQGVVENGLDGREFQLITWSKDKTLRFWPVPREMMQKTGSITKESELTPKFQYKDDWVSFRSPPPGTDPLPALSVPVGFRSILAEVRAPVHSQTTNPVLLPHRGSAARGLARETPQSKDSNGTRPVHPSSSVPSSIAGRRGGTMSKGSAVGKPAKIDPFQWLSSVRPETVSSSRHSSDSRPTSGPDKDGSGTDSGSRKRSQSRGRGDDGGHREAEKSASSLLDEIHSVDRKLTSSKIKLEKYDLTKRRTCTFGLHGPWGDSATVHVFIRVTFAFPRDYPHASYPGGVPTVDIERTPLVSTKRRAYMVRRLREIRETRRPCLEPCLRFLLFSDGRQPGRSPSIDSGSSSEDERPQDGRKSRDLTVAILRDHKNLAEPRTSQGVFGPNGQLVCFFRSLPRIVKSAHGDISSSPSLAARGAETVPKLFQSPLLLSDAVRRLVVSANDQSFGSLQSKWPEDSENIIRIMNNLVSFSQPGRRAFENTRSAEKVPGNYALVTKRVTVIHIKDRAFVVGAHRAVAADYEHLVDDPAYFCETNAAVAHSHSRFDHERVFRFLRMFFHTRKDGHRRGDELNNRDRQGTPLSSFMIVRQYKELLASRDIQLLAMFVVVVLKMYRQQAMKSPPNSRPSTRQTSPLPVTPSRLPITDYFSMRRRKDTYAQPMSPMVPRLPSSPTTPIQAPSLSSSSSSRGSWSSLFNAGTVRHLMSSAQEPFRDDSSGRNEPTTATIPVPGGGRSRGVVEITRKNTSADKSAAAIRSSSTKSWPDPPLQTSALSTRLTVTFSSAGHITKKPTFSRVISPEGRSANHGKTIVIEHAQEEEKTPSLSEALDNVVLRQMVQHVLAYADMLFGWEFHQKRAQLLKSIPNEFHVAQEPSNELEQERLQIFRMCSLCSTELKKSQLCPKCNTTPLMPCCSVCRLPVKGLSHTCLSCSHVTHVRCRRDLQFTSCPAGCGCRCDGGFEV